MHHLRYTRDGKPFEGSLEEWTKKVFGGPGSNKVAFTRIWEKANPHICYEVSTIFLGINHNYSGNGDPVLFETIVFYGANDSTDIDAARYTTEQKALDGHKQFVAKYINKLMDAKARNYDVTKMD